MNMRPVFSRQVSTLHPILVYYTGFDSISEVQSKRTSDQLDLCTQHAGE